MGAEEGQKTPRNCGVQPDLVAHLDEAAAAIRDAQPFTATARTPLSLPTREPGQPKPGAAGSYRVPGPPTTYWPEPGEIGLKVQIKNVPGEALRCGDLRTTATTSQDTEVSWPALTADGRSGESARPSDSAAPDGRSVGFGTAALSATVGADCPGASRQTRVRGMGSSFFLRPLLSNMRCGRSRDRCECRCCLG